MASFYWRKSTLIFTAFFLYWNLLCESKQNGPYKPTWDSLDSRPVPTWFDDSKVGIFIHWGVFSVPSFGSEWFWSNWKIAKSKAHIEFMEANYKPNFTYPEFAPMFTTSFFNPKHWAKVFKDSGAKYVVLTSKHHEGYTLWPSKYSWNWNSVDVGPKRDLVRDVADAVRGAGLTFGLYHSLYEWFHPLYLQDKNNKWTTRDFPERKTIPELYELVNTYKPEIVWSDGEWEASTEYWGSREFLAWLYNESPVKESVCVNDRWGINTLCKHGGYLTCTDRYNPGKLLPRKWENAMTLDKTSWGYNRRANSTTYVTIEELIQTMAQTISCGGNILINVGPTADGIIAPIMEERLLQLGEWLRINGEAIYKTQPWKYQNDTKTPEVWYTKSKQIDAVFAIVVNRPENGILQLASMNETMHEKSKVSMITSKGDVPLKWHKVDNTIEITLIYSMHTKWAVVLKFTDLKDNHNHIELS